MKTKSQPIPISFETMVPLDGPPTVTITSGEWEGTKYFYKDLTFKYAYEDGDAKLRFSYEVVNWGDSQQNIEYDIDNEPFERLIGNILAHICESAEKQGPSQ